MSDDARDLDGPQDEDRLPWLEAVEEDEDQDGPSAAKLVAAVVIGLVAIGLIVGGLFWLGNRDREGGGGEVIAAPEGDYKVKPSDPGGMPVDDRGSSAAAASQGDQTPGRLDPRALPERPVTPPAPARPEPQRPAPPPVRPAPPPPAPVAGGATIQLGAFSTQAGAAAAWRAMSGRFRYLAPLSHSVIPYRTGGRTLYRLRASGPDAAGICRRLEIAGEDCAVVS